MPALKRIKTNYPGVYYIESKGARGLERVYYISYRREGRRIEEKAGRQYRDDMTPARAAGLRAERIDGRQLSNKERRNKEKKLKEIEAGKWTLNRLWEEYSENKDDKKLLLTDKYRYQKFLAKPFGKKEPSQIIQLEVDRLRLRMLKTHAPQTVKHVLNLLTRIANFGKKKGLCSGLSFVVQKPRVDNIVTEDLTPEQLQRLIVAIDEDTNHLVAAMMKMALFTGMRRGELLKLKWDDVNFNTGFIWIRSPKGGRDASIPMSEAVRELLRSVSSGDSQYVFPGEGGEQRVQIYHVVIRIKRRAGLPKSFRPMHGLRHVYASMMASSGKVDMYTHQRLLTHKSPIMTQRYAHLRDETLKNAAEIANGIIKKASGGGNG